MTGAATTGLQLGCLAIVVVYLALRLRHGDRRAFTTRFAVLMVASWLAENSCIRLYGFYAYDASWWGFIDQVPILIVAIWPVVIHSAMDLAKSMAAGRWSKTRIAWIGALIVLTDAALIEPIAVFVGLWRWTEPGLFEVPPIGVLGWAMFTWLAMSVFVREGEDVEIWGVKRWVRVRAIFALVVAPAAVHLMLLGAWWVFFRHVNGTIDARVGVVVAAIISVVVVFRMLKSNGPWPSVSTVMMRGPGAGFFFVLLILYALGDTALTAYAACFAIPWIVLVTKSIGPWGR